MSRRAFYICSLPHSGSTMFSVFLGTHSRLIGLGGIERSVRLLADAREGNGAKKAEKLHCTCGKSALDCTYWGAVASGLSSVAKNDARAEYAHALDTFTTVFGTEAWPVDSSKHIEPLDQLREVKDLDLRVVHLIKDVRGLATSFIDQARRQKRTTRPGAIMALEYFWRWRRENGKFDTYFARHGVRALRTGYEEVCLAPEIMMGVISKFLDLPSEPGSLDFNTSKSHLIVGNRMRDQEEKQTLRYDHRWMARRDWILAAALLPQILRYNSTAVYGNGCDEMWTR